MRLTMKERKSVVRVTARRYRDASKKQKKQILCEFIETTGYNRCYASYLLRNHGRKVAIGEQSFRLDAVKPRRRHKRGKYYDRDVYTALRRIWLIMDCICGKRLKPVLGEIVRKLQEHNEARFRAVVRRKLLRISAATIDRMLAGDRKRFELKGRSHTKPGTLLKRQIPIRTFADWNENRPGFAEIDLVGHEGGNPRGDFLETLDATDICSCWTETEAVRNKAQIHVFAGLKAIKARLPFALLGIDSDNGSEFINDQLYRFCIDNEITFTRGRSSRKNDNCYVEQKNYSVVRRAVGYARYDTDEELAILNALYRRLRLYTNYFQPVMKLLERRREGSRVYKKHDEAKTPYARLLGNPDFEETLKGKLRREYATLNPAQLKREITKLQDRLMELNRRKKRADFV
jgi:hypothetical protein